MSSGQSRDGTALPTGQIVAILIDVHNQPMQPIRVENPPPDLANIQVKRQGKALGANGVPVAHMATIQARKHLVRLNDGSLFVIYKQVNADRASQGRHNGPGGAVA